eukprot:scaffold33125_cov43-Attheya_sp.AAC.2
MACATNSLYQRAENAKESKSEQSICCLPNMRFAPSFLLAHGSGIFAMQPQIVAPTPKGSS